MENNKRNEKLVREQLAQRSQQLDQELREKIEKEKVTRGQLERLDNEFQKIRRHQLLHLFDPVTIKKFIRATGAYLLGRRNRKQLYSKTYKRKQASNDVKKYKYALYNEGFTEKALHDLQRLLKETNNRYVKRAISWEIALWHANKQTKDGAFQAIPYLKVAKHGESDIDLLRRIAIVEAECYGKLQQTEQANQVLTDILRTKHHPDIYFALANIEQSKQDRLKWINKTYEMYELKPIEWCVEKDDVMYDDLRTTPIHEKRDGPKISVILPAYNAEQGIQTAIESILSQTWENIELLIVDDCSTDNTLQVANTYLDKNARIKVLSTPKNSGPYIARNIALQQATGEFVTVNDADDWSHAEKLEIQAEHLRNNPNIIANTSEQARLTEEIQFYRRGTPGRYIFSNMSSLMFRRELVMEKIGYWDEVRFAADGEFKRRLIQTFGQDAVVDLQTGPLSLPRQSASSLTSSSAFGYNGFFMGARKEYVESFSYYHKQATHLYYPFEQTNRLFPVPEAMRPNRQMKERKFDVVMVADFYDLHETNVQLLIEEIKKNKQLGLQTALVQMSSYRLNKKKVFNEQIRQLIDGERVQMVVYGETITCNVLIIRSPVVLQERQQFIPKIHTITALVIIDEMPIIEYNGKKEPNYKIRQCLHRMMAYFDKRGRWYPLNKQVRTDLLKRYEREIRAINLTYENWINDRELNEEKYAIRLKDWLVERSH